MLIQNGEVNGVRLLSPKAVEVMTTNYLTAADRQQVRFGDVFDPSTGRLIKRVEGKVVLSANGLA